MYIFQIEKTKTKNKTNTKWHTFGGIFGVKSSNALIIMNHWYNKAL